MHDIDSKIKDFVDKVEKDLFRNIVPFWLDYSTDTENGGFYGRITNDRVAEKNAPKSLILHTRILWTFAYLYQFRPQQAYLDMCKRAYSYIMDKFQDKEYGGMYWMLDAQGRVIENNKKMYGQAFTVYALSEYFKVTRSQEILQQAIELFNLIEDNNYDKANKGYYEGSFRNWQVDKNISLSVVDMNEVKSMNTHLHLMEAYTNLLSVWPDEKLASRLTELTDIHFDYILDQSAGHLKLFFDEQWNSKSKKISFGHDIECSWLLCEAVDVLNDPQLTEKAQKIACDMVDISIKQAFDENNIIYAEKDANGSLNTEMEWWQQAEAMVGFVNAYGITKEARYLEWAIRIWDVINTYLVDQRHGEWFYSTDQQTPASHKYKVSEWKGPYHNVRACLEVLRRLDNKV